jgi:hypothetical protein
MKTVMVIAASCRLAARMLPQSDAAMLRQIS